ncbi:DciA family protein [Treponema sp.]|uniref:DciA family protein n=1 Tax=Treponema sp. TaxID=166 RepID=UPI003FD855D9
MEEAEKISFVIESAFENIRTTNAGDALNIYNVWKNVLCRIKGRSPNEGQKLADHSRVIDYKNGILLVEADHPGWIELLRLHKKYIMTGLERDIPQIKITNVVYRLAGHRGEIFDTRNMQEKDSDTRSKMQQRLDEEEKIIKKTGISVDKKHETAQKKALPPELAAIFDDLRQSMLTNSKD